MSTEDRKRRWNMLDSYQEGQKIYGRDAEISSISESIQYNIQTFLYGKSGIGKTSLLQAGIFPVLREKYFFPVIVRLGFYENEPLAEVVKRLIQEAAEEENPKIGKKALLYSSIDGSDLSAVPLWQFFSKMKFTDEEGIPYIPVLVLDQFEETINNEINWQKTVDFLRDNLYDLLDNSLVTQGTSLPYTNYRIVFSMREDYLYCLEDIIDQFSLWELRYNRFRIKALDEKNAEIVIRETFGPDGLEKGEDKKIVSTIIKLVKINSGTRFTEINTALLSLICSLLEDHAISSYSPEEGQFVRLSDLRLINPLLSTYYEDICDHIGATATKYLEKHLLTSDGRRSSIDRQEALKSGKIKDEQLTYLEDRHLIRRIKTDSVSVRYEYIHDLFAKMIARRKREDRIQWWKPEYSTISKRRDVNTFFLKSLSWLLFFLLDLAITELSARNQGVSVIKAVNGYLYLLFFGFAAILLPITVKRLHDGGLSGWIVAGVPIAFSFCCLKAFFPVFYNSILMDIIFGTTALIGGGYIIFFICLLCKPSVVRSYRAAASLRYETICNSSYINNSEFALGLSAEIIFWLITCLVTDVVYILITNEVRMYKLIAGLIYDLFHVTIVAYPFFLFFPIVICFSPSLKSRMASIGYNRKWGYVPIVNLFFLIIGLLPNTILSKLHFCREKIKPTNQQDNIFAELNDSFTPIAVKSSRIKAYSPGFWKGVLLVLVPFYAFIQAFGKNKSLEEKAYSPTFVFYHYLFVYLAVVFVVLGINEGLDEKFITILLPFLIIETICFWVTFVIILKRQKIIVLGIIQKNPHFSREDIAALCKNCWTYKRTNQIIDKLMKKGILRRIDTDGEITWEIVDPKWRK